MKHRYGATFGGAMAFVLAACSPLKTFDTLVPKDRGGALIVGDAAYGSDPRQHLDIYAPRRHGAAPLPIIVFFYGGSWNSGTKTGYSFVGRALAARGFVVAIPDYRLLPQIRYPVFLEDNAAAVRWVRAHAGTFGGDPDRLVLAGHSAGAYDAAMLALDPKWLGADRGAVKAFVGLAGPYDFLPLQGVVVKETFGDVPDRDATQPVNHVSTDSPPAFLATGDKDQVVLPRNSDSLAVKLKAKGVFVERQCYAEVGHAGLITAFAKPLRNRAAVLEDLTAFLRRIVG
jgi:acetyl esterase/lipase